MGFSLKSNFKKLKEIGRQDWNNPEEELFDLICHYIARFVYRLYGKTYIGRWVEQNKGRTFLDLFTASDAAYTTMIIEGNQDVWAQAVKIAQMEPSEQAKFKAKNRIKLSDEEQKKYTKKKGKFTKRMYKAEYLECSTTKEGKLFYKDQYYQWRGIMRKKDVMERLSIVWDEHVKNNSFGHHWLSKEQRMEADRGDDDREGVYFPLSLPGDDDFNDDRPWDKSNEKVHGSHDEDDDVQDGAASGSDEEQSYAGEEEGSDDDDSDEGSYDVEGKKDNRYSYSEMTNAIAKGGNRKKRKHARVSMDNIRDGEVC